MYQEFLDVYPHQKLTKIYRLLKWYVFCAYRQKQTFILQHFEQLQIIPRVHDFQAEQSQCDVKGNFYFLQNLVCNI